VPYLAASIAQSSVSVSSYDDCGQPLTGTPLRAAFGPGGRPDARCDVAMITSPVEATLETGFAVGAINWPAGAVADARERF
jgi:hypothetical protein